MRNILLLVHSDSGQEARVQAALDLARALRAHLSCLDVAAKPVMSGPIPTALAEKTLLAEEQAREAANRTRLEARLARDDIAWTWVDVVGHAAEALKRHAGLADIIIVSCQFEDESFPDLRRIAADVVIESDRLVAAIPRDARGFNVSGKALVAWNGSDKSANALRNALPLLQLASEVVIVEVADASVKAPAEEAALYLSRHGIEPLVIRRPRDGARTGDVLIAEAQAQRVDYVVMGAFGRSRLVEAIFGGVSQQMLANCPVPTVMSH